MLAAPEPDTFTPGAPALAAGWKRRAHGGRFEHRLGPVPDLELLPANHLLDLAAGVLSVLARAGDSLNTRGSERTNSRNLKGPDGSESFRTRARHHSLDLPRRTGREPALAAR